MAIEKNGFVQRARFTTAFSKVVGMPFFYLYHYCKSLTAKARALPNGCPTLRVYTISLCVRSRGACDRQLDVIYRAIDLSIGIRATLVTRYRICRDSIYSIR